MKQTKSIIILLFFLFLSLSCLARIQEELPIGNFALAVSQRPRPLFSFGQNLVDQGDFLISDTITFLPGKRRSEFVNTLAFLYGFTDYLHVLFNIPVPVYRKVDEIYATKIGDINIQAEYQFYQQETETSAFKTMIYANLFMPSGILVEPSPTNFSKYIIHHNFANFLLGTIWAYTTIDWYGFIAFADLFAFKKDTIRLSNTFFFQSGIGHNLGIYDDKILFLLLELYTVSNGHTKVCNIKDANSGGLTLFIGPSFWYSTERMIVQIGLDIPVLQKLNGDQPKSTVYGSVSFTWKI